MDSDLHERLIENATCLETRMTVLTDVRWPVGWPARSTAVMGAFRSDGVWKLFIVENGRGGRASLVLARNDDTGDKAVAVAPEGEESFQQMFWEVQNVAGGDEIVAWGQGGDGGYYVWGAFVLATADGKLVFTELDREVESCIQTGHHAWEILCSADNQIDGQGQGVYTVTFDASTSSLEVNFTGRYDLTQQGVAVRKLAQDAALAAKYQANNKINVRSHQVFLLSSSRRLVVLDGEFDLYEGSSRISSLSVGSAGGASSSWCVIAGSPERVVCSVQGGRSVVMLLGLRNGVLTCDAMHVIGVVHFGVYDATTDTVFLLKSAEKKHFWRWGLDNPLIRPVRALRSEAAAINSRLQIFPSAKPPFAATEGPVPVDLLYKLQCVRWESLGAAGRFLLYGYCVAEGAFFVMEGVPAGLAPMVLDGDPPFLRKVPLPLPLPSEEQLESPWHHSQLDLHHMGSGMFRLASQNLWGAWILDARLIAWDKVLGNQNTEHTCAGYAAQVVPVRHYGGAYEVWETQIKWEERAHLPHRMKRVYVLLALAIRHQHPLFSKINHDILNVIFKFALQRWFD